MVYVFTGMLDFLKTASASLWQCLCAWIVAVANASIPWGRGSVTPPHVFMQNVAENGMVAPPGSPTANVDGRITTFSTGGYGIMIHGNPLVMPTLFLHAHAQVPSHRPYNLTTLTNSSTWNSGKTRPVGSVVSLTLLNSPVLVEV